MVLGAVTKVVAEAVVGAITVVETEAVAVVVGAAAGVVVGKAVVVIVAVRANGKAMIGGPPGPWWHPATRIHHGCTAAQG